MPRPSSSLVYVQGIRRPMHREQAGWFPSHYVLLVGFGTGRDERDWNAGGG